MTDNPGNGSSPVRFRADGPVGRITLSNPARRNAFTARSLRILGDSLDQALDDPAVRVVVLAAEGSAFCSGADLEGSTDEDLPRLYAAVLEAMRDSTKPLVARVQGAVRGGGNGLVASSDVAIASEEASFAFSEVRVGAVPAVVSVPCLRRMRRSDATELMLTGEVFTPERAREAGLVQHVVPAAGLDDAVSRTVDALLRGAPSALAVTRQLLRDVPTLEEDEALRWTAELSAQMFASEDAREGRDAFEAKRAPSWVDEEPAGS